MPVLFLTEEEVRRLLPMAEAVEAVEQVFRKLALDEAENVPRRRCQTDHVMLHVLPAAAKSIGAVGFKAYTAGRQGARFHVTLYDGKTGEMLALMEADHLGRIRTGAASGVATRCLARPGAKTLGLYGTGRQARTQLEAVCAVRPIERAHVYSRDAVNRAAFAAEMSAALGLEVVPVDDPREAAEGLDVVVTATASREPVLHGEWLAEGCHLNAVGSNFLAKAELDVEAVRRCGLVVVDHKEQAKLEAGDFVEPLEQGVLKWPDVAELGQVLTGRRPGRAGEGQITLFKSLGIGAEDIAAAAVVYRKAREQGAGRELF